MTDILRFVGGGLLCLVCCYIGILIKGRYNARERFYTSAVAFTDMLASEMKLHKTTVPDIVEKFVKANQGKKKGKSEFEEMLKKHIEQRKKGEEQKIDIHFINGNEAQEMFSFMHALGSTTLQDQLDMIEGYAKLFEDKKQKCQKESKQLGGMYFKLCVLLGLALILIVM